MDDSETTRSREVGRRIDHRNAGYTSSTQPHGPRITHSNCNQYRPGGRWAPVETAQRTQEQTARRVNLKQTDFEQHGYSGGCEGCARLQAGMGPRPHSEACRTRLEEELGKGSGGNRRWQAAQDRQLARSATNAALEEMREKKRRLANRKTRRCQMTIQWKK